MMYLTRNGSIEIWHNGFVGKLYRLEADDPMHSEHGIRFSFSPDEGRDIDFDSWQEAKAWLFDYAQCAGISSTIERM